MSHTLSRYRLSLDEFSRNVSTFMDDSDNANRRWLDAVIDDVLIDNQAAVVRSKVVSSRTTQRILGELLQCN